MKKPVLILVLAIVFVVSAITVGAGYFAYQYAKKAPSTEATEVVYEVLPNKAFNSVAKDLELSGVIINAKMFSIYARIKNQRHKMKMGEYLFRTNMTPDEVIEVLSSGKSIERKFTIPEGLNMYEIADLYESAQFGTKENFLQLCKDKEFAKNLTGEDLENLEGYLYPETYALTKFTSTKELISLMVKSSLDQLNTLLPDGKNWVGTRHAFMTFASLVEKESGHPEDRPMVASVFKNRIEKKMRLQTDPTILYGILDSTGELKKNITKADILTPSRYNTYTIDGLPPGPISNPGVDSMRAALSPPQTNYLFFVSRNDGTTQFSESLQDHNQAVQKFQIDPKAREGKSWRDLSKDKK